MTAVAATTGRNTADRTNHSDFAWPSRSSASANPITIEPSVWPTASTSVCPIAARNRSSPRMRA